MCVQILNLNLRTFCLQHHAGHCAVAPPPNPVYVTVCGLVVSTPRNTQQYASCVYDKCAAVMLGSTLNVLPRLPAPSSEIGKQRRACTFLWLLASANY